jgi:hypothetical protein
MRLEVKSIQRDGIRETTSKTELYRYTRQQASRNVSREYPHNWATKSCEASISIIPRVIQFPWPHL